MRVVDQSQSTVERELLAGQVGCPACGGPLRPWGRARRRAIRLGAAGDRAVRPRRARCAACRATHVLLPDWMVVRRAYAAPVIWGVLAAHAHGLGYRRIALTSDLPETTVRDWLRAGRRPAAPESHTPPTEPDNATRPPPAPDRFAPDRSTPDQRSSPHQPTPHQPTPDQSEPDQRSTPDQAEPASNPRYTPCPPPDPVTSHNATPHQDRPRAPDPPEDPNLLRDPDLLRYPDLSRALNPAFEHHGGTQQPWRLAVRLTHGWLLGRPRLPNTSPPQVRPPHSTDRPP